MLRPPVLGLCLRALMAERPVALPLKKGGRMSTVDEYHKFARDCLRWAAKARTEEAAKAAAEFGPRMDAGRVGS